MWRFFRTQIPKSSASSLRSSSGTSTSRETISPSRATCSQDHLDRQREIEKFWLTTLDLPDSTLRKSVVNVYSKYSQKKRTNMLPYGTCRVVVHRTSVVQHIYGAIQEYGGFDWPEWLD